MLQKYHGESVTIAKLYSFAPIAPTETRFWNEIGKLNLYDRNWTIINESNAYFHRDRLTT